MSSVWQNATETEVYAASLALALATIAVGGSGGTLGESAVAAAGRVPDRAGGAAPYERTRRGAGRDVSRRASRARAIRLGARGGRVGRDDRWPPASVAFPSCSSAWVIVIAAAGIARDVSADVRSNARWRCRRGPWRSSRSSALLILPARARARPAINQGNPRTIEHLAYVVSRRQYAVQGVWPRQAPLWLQLANWFEYADWQFALSLGPTVIPTVARIVGDAGICGAGDRRRAMAVQRGSPDAGKPWCCCSQCGSLGVIAYLNLKAGTFFRAGASSPRTRSMRRGIGTTSLCSASGRGAFGPE